MKKKFKIQISTDSCAGTYLQDSGIRLGLLTPDGDSYQWIRFLRILKDGDLLQIKLMAQSKEELKP